MMKLVALSNQELTTILYTLVKSARDWPKPAGLNTDLDWLMGKFSFADSEENFKR